MDQTIEETRPSSPSELLGDSCFARDLTSCSAPIKAVCELFANLNAQQVTRENFAKAYRDDIVFTDPLHVINGLDNLLSYSASLYSNVQSCHFEFERILERDGEATLIWQMHLVHPKLNGGKLVIVPGVTHVLFEERIYYHRDYFDAGAMLYEQLPLLKQVIRWLKARLK
ncbi:nuclear transport factor 2 family protein [Umboniibacter marinipuniceus]|uniref:SnoaL-like protein n=1 Tax=Umboniibacter marinipuniceus TaxID=569599 RepID=A0A3M0AD43_9GAMM|nr:nuclear transport factor 2 family protein [Umboniibacter marinipuniceus]RMA82456.1 SnoaL-like protein [Umboniibacter marinipuniceus]